MMETTIYYFHASFYIPAIQRSAFHLLPVRILGTNQYGELRLTASKCRKLFQDVICRRDYAERVVARSYHKIKS